MIGRLRILLLAGAIAFAAGLKVQADVLVLYEGERGGLGHTSAKMMDILLGHFAGLERRLLPQREYVSESADDTELLVYIRTGEDSQTNRALIGTLSTQEGQALLIGADLSWLPDGQLGGVDFGETVQDFTTIRYNTTKLPSDYGALARVAAPSDAEILAVAESGEGESLPYALRSGKTWFILDQPFWYHTPGDRLLVLADVLHDILDRHGLKAREAFVRIEDVVPDTDPARIWAITDYLRSRDIPFLLAVVPILRVPGEPAHLISDEPELLEALRYAARNGGIIGLHGLTHQTDGSTGYEPEFYDIPDSTAREFTDERIDTGLSMLAAERLYPLIWMTPNNAALPEAYSAVAVHFTTAMERRLATADRESEVTSPYKIDADSYGMRLFPTNLGYVKDDDAAGSVNRMLTLAGRHVALRDPSVGFEFHPYVDIKLLDSIVSGLVSQGYRFSDPRTGVHRVSWAGGTTTDVKLAARVETGRSLYLTADGVRATTNGQPAFQTMVLEDIETAKFTEFDVGKRRVLQPLEGGIYVGAFVSGGTEDQVDRARIEAFEAQTGSEIGWVYFSQNWSDGIRFPAAAVASLRAAGKTPFIRLMPRSGFESDKSLASLPDPIYSLDSILAGKWDAQLRQWAAAARDSGGPLILDFAPEMNGDWFRWSGSVNGGGKTDAYGARDLADGPERYRDAFRHIVDLFREKGVINATWVFHPFAGTTEQPDWNRIEAFYPGDDYVDWLAVSAYGAQGHADPWQTFEEVFDETYAQLRAMAPTKPIMVAEFGVRDDPGLPERKGQWIRDALQSIAHGRFPAIRGVSWWNESWTSADGTTIDLRISSSPAALDAYRSEVSQPIFGRELQFSNEEKLNRILR